MEQGRLSYWKMFAFIKVNKSNKLENKCIFCNIFYYMGNMPIGSVNPHSKIQLNHHAQVITKIFQVTTVHSCLSPFLFLYRGLFCYNVIVLKCIYVVWYYVFWMWMVWRWPWAREEWLWRQRVNARKIGNSGELWYICNWMSSRWPFLLGPLFFRTVLPCSGGYHLGRSGMPLHDVVGINCKKGSTTAYQGADVKYIYIIVLLSFV